MKSINIGIVGATGLVGETFLTLLHERETPVGELRLFASEASLGKKISFHHKQIPVEILHPDRFKGLDLVFFSSGDPISKEWAPIAVKSGAWAVDNSAAFRMDGDTPLVVPEINMHHITDKTRPQIIANPNCSTIQLVMALEALKSFEPSHVHVASYQAVSGAGKDAIEDLRVQTSQVLEGHHPEPGKNFKRPISFDCHPIIGGLDPDGFCSEENKIVAETKKILSCPDMKVSAFTVRVPTFNGHAEAVWVQFKKPTDRAALTKALKSFPGVQFTEAHQEFAPIPFVSGKDDVFVSRLRQSRDMENTWQMWVVADNVRRGAASNGLFIAEKLFA